VEIITGYETEMEYKWGSPEEVESMKEEGWTEPPEPLSLEEVVDFPQDDSLLLLLRRTFHRIHPGHSPLASGETKSLQNRIGSQGPAAPSRRRFGP